jgi:uncharacterized protein (DUF1501 family)
MRSLPPAADTREEVAERFLSSLDHVGEAVLSRRRALQIASGVAASTVLASRVPFLRNAVGIGTADAANQAGTVVLVYLDGGNDGLNTLVPLNSGKYRDLRASVAIDGATTLPINTDYGLHSSLPYVQSMWNAGQAAFVRGVGYTNNNLSHFTSVDHWHHGYGAAGSAITASPHSGWAGRFADSLGPSNPFTSVAIGSQTPISLRGTSVSALQIPIATSQLLGNNLGDLNEKWVVDALRGLNSTGTGTGALGTALAARAVSAINVAPQVAGCWNAADGTSISRQMTMAANLINARLGVRVISVSFDGFDTHAQQTTTHARLLSDLNNALAGFFARIDPTLSRSVTVMTYSEFGRRGRANDSGGTDHGSSSIAMVLGSNVAGGMYGEDPGVDVLDNDGNTRVTTDFRRLYATVLEGWLETDSASILGASHAIIPLFAAPAGAIPSTSTTTSTTTTLPASTTSTRSGAPQAGPVATIAGRTGAAQGSSGVTTPRSQAPQASAPDAVAPVANAAASASEPVLEPAPESAPATAATSTSMTERSLTDTTSTTSVVTAALPSVPSPSTGPAGETILIPVAPITAPIATVAVTVKAGNGTIAVEVKQGPVRNDTWIGLFAPGTPHGAALSIRYLNNRSRPSVVTRTSGKVRFDRLAAGKYEIRVFANGSTTPNLVIPTRVIRA